MEQTLRRSKHSGGANSGVEQHLGRAPLTAGFAPTEHPSQEHSSQEHPSLEHTTRHPSRGNHPCDEPLFGMGSDANPVELVAWAIEAADDRSHRWRIGRRVIEAAEMEYYDAALNYRPK